MNARRPIRLLSSSSGLTLLELLIAMVVLAFGLMGVSGMIMTSVRGNTYGARMTQVTTLAQDKIEEMRNVPYDNLYSGCNIVGFPVVCPNVPQPMENAVAQPNDSGLAGDEAAGDGLWTFQYNDPAKPLPAGMTLIWGVKRNYPQPRLVWLMAKATWTERGKAHTIVVDSVRGNFD